MRTAFATILLLPLFVASVAEAIVKKEIVNGPYVLSRRSTEIDASVEMCVATWKFTDLDAPKSDVLYSSGTAKPENGECPKTFDPYKKTEEKFSANAILEGTKIDSITLGTETPIEWEYKAGQNVQVLFFRIVNGDTGQATWDAVCAPLRTPKDSFKASELKEPVLDVCERESPIGIIHDAEKEKRSVKCPYIDKCLGEKRIFLKVRSTDGKLVTHTSPGLPRLQDTDDHVSDKP